jgi:hypothetical protein
MPPRIAVRRLERRFSLANIDGIVTSDSRNGAGGTDRSPTDTRGAGYPPD